MDWAWPVHLAVLIVFGIAINRMTRLVKRDDPASERTWFGRSVSSNTDLTRYVGTVPIWFKIAILLEFVWAATGFGHSLPVGTVQDINGQHQLLDHGHLIRILSDAEYDRFQNLLLRGFSSIWIVFSTMAYAYWAYVIPAATADARS
jgi:hypothetical protein